MARILKTPTNETFADDEKSVTQRPKPGRKGGNTEPQVRTAQDESENAPATVDIAADNEAPASPAEPRTAGLLTTSLPAPELASAKVTKAALVIEALRNENGASIEEIMAMTEWQAHSVRGFISGTVKKKLGLAITRTVDADGVPRYKIVDTALSLAAAEAPATAEEVTDASNDGTAKDVADEAAAEQRRLERRGVKRGVRIATDIAPATAA